MGTAVTDVMTMWDRKLAYARPGFSGLLDIVSGKRHELESSGPLVSASAILFAGSPTGLRMWRASRPAPKLIEPGAATDVAIDDDGVYWLDATGAPRFRTVG